MTDPDVTDASPPPVLVWRWLPAAAALVAAIPAVLITALVDVESGAALALGMIPALAIGIPRPRRRRVIILAASAILGVPITLGAAVSPWPALALATLLILPVLATWGAQRLDRPRLSTLLIVLAPPMVGIGLSLDGLSAGLRLTGLFIVGAIITFIVAVAIPESRLPGSDGNAGSPPPRLPGVAYGLTLGVVGVITAGIGFAFDLDHVGWACAAALLVMRPDAALQQWRTIGRFVSVLVGAAAAALLVESAPDSWVFAVAVGVVLAAAGGTRGSRWYILPAFTTFLVILMLTADDVASAPGRFAERTGETALGLVVAAVIGFGAPAVSRRFTRNR
ncbi:FUSC family protein [Gordonia insulae]|uniref:FUSC family protein n=1 Tax=Gordonia insulae TaxID=2420509 RepID=UPI001E5B5404|nr:FUSC family protein [Gordonia insulae]